MNERVIQLNKGENDLIGRLVKQELSTLSDRTDITEEQRQGTAMAIRNILEQVERDHGITDEFNRPYIGVCKKCHNPYTKDDILRDQCGICRQNFRKI